MGKVKVSYNFKWGVEERGRVPCNVPVPCTTSNSECGSSQHDVEDKAYSERDACRISPPTVRTKRRRMRQSRTIALNASMARMSPRQDPMPFRTSANDGTQVRFSESILGRNVLLAG